MADPTKQAEAHGQQLKEKAAREQLSRIVIHQWPMDESGRPMAIVMGAGSDLVPTVQFGNVCIGPVTIMRPVSNESLERVIEEGQAVQKAAEYIVGTERRLLQWSIDPSSRITHPTTGAEFTGDAQPAVAQGAAEPAGAPASPGGETATSTVAPATSSAPPVSAG